jgi:hypothetical protein
VQWPLSQFLAQPGAKADSGLAFSMSRIAEQYGSMGICSLRADGRLLVESCAQSSRPRRLLPSGRHAGLPGTLPVCRRGKSMIDCACGAG